MSEKNRYPQRDHWKQSYDGGDILDGEKDNGEGDEDEDENENKYEEYSTGWSQNPDYSNFSGPNKASGVTDFSRLHEIEEDSRFDPGPGIYDLQGQYKPTPSAFPGFGASSDRAPKTRKSMQNLPSTETRHKPSGKHQKSSTDYRPSSGRSYSDVPSVYPSTGPAEQFYSVDMPETALYQGGNNPVESELRAENERLKSQLRAVQGERLSALDDFQPCSDSELKDAFVQLQHQVSTYSRHLKTRLAKSKHLATVLDGELSSGYPTEAISMKYFFESFLWRQLYVECFKSPFVLLRPENSAISSVWSIVFGEGLGTDPTASESSEKWRSLTAKEVFGKITLTKKSDRVKGITASLLSRIATLDSQLHKCLAETDQLERLFEKGWDVAATFSQQRCRLNLTVPNTVANLDSNWVDVVQEVNHTESTVFAVSPSLIKWGNGHGQNLSAWLCIVKAKAIRVSNE